MIPHCLSLVTLLCLLVAEAGGGERIYHRVLVKDIATTIHTHICTTGLVALIKKEADGDVHVRVEDGDGSKAFVVVEVIPTLRPTDASAIRIPKLGEWIEVCGITRYDKKHGWDEIHPVERLR